MKSISITRIVSLLLTSLAIVLGIYISSNILIKYYGNSNASFEIPPSPLDQNPFLIIEWKDCYNSVDNIGPIKYELDILINKVFQSLDLSESTQRDLAISQFYKDSLAEKLIYNNTESDCGTKTLSLNVCIEYVSNDRSFAVLMVDSLRQITYCKASNYQAINLSQQKIILIKEDDGWKIMHHINEDIRREKPSVTRAKTINISEIKGINYYPKSTPWSLFWKEYKSEVIKEDMSLIKTYKLNALRVFLPYNEFALDNSEASRNLQNLKDFLQIAKLNDIMVIPTLFDYPIGFEIEKYDRYISQLGLIINEIKGIESILAWDVKNELDLDFDHQGKDASLRWARFMVNEIRNLDPSRPVSIGWSNIKYATELVDELDYISLHQYGKFNEEQYSEIKAFNKSIMIEEFGESTRNRWSNLLGKSQSTQLNNAKEVINYAESQNMGWMLWTLHDFTELPEGSFGWKPWVKSKQKNMGILDVEGNPKELAKYLKNRE